MPRLESADHSPARRGNGRRGRLRVASSLAEINVVPLVDVMLVLLVIFMVTAPMMQQGFAVNLPKVRQAPPLSAEPIYVTVPRQFHVDQRVQVGDQWVSLGVLHERIRQALEGRATKDVYLRMDGSLTIEDTLRVIQEMNSGGAERVAFVTQPPDVGK